MLTPEAPCKKWRYLKDSYMRIRNDLKKRSGFAASKLIKWKWYNHLSFLHDVQDSHRLVNLIEYRIKYLHIFKYKFAGIIKLLFLFLFDIFYLFLCLSQRILYYV